MTHARRFFRFLRAKWLLIAIVVVAIVLAYAFTHRQGKPAFESVLVARGNVIEKVSVTGAVLPMSKADLAFKKSGVIEKIAVKVGDHVRKGQVIASIDDAADVATLASAQAQLDELRRGLRPEEYALYKSNLDAASTVLSNAKKDAVNAALDSYVKAQSAMVNYADTFFNDPQSVNPRINIPLPSAFGEDAINAGRVLVADTLSRWKKDNDAASAGSVSASDLISRAEGYTDTMKSFLNDLSSIVNKLTPSGSGLTQAAIDADISTMNTALATITQAITGLSSSDTALKSAQSAYTQAGGQFNLQLAGSSSDLISAQAAKVSAAQAALDDDSLVSPIDGVVTRADPSAGEFVTAGQSGFAVQSAGGYKIEAFVPEADIAKVAIGNTASVTLDAYGSYVFFPASVTSIDPAETVLQGVPTYKVTLNFKEQDGRVRSGMTANTDILTHQVDNVIVVPSRAIVDDNGAKSVRVVNADGKTYVSVPVTPGLKGSEGLTEIVSGLSEGDRVVTYVK